MVKIFTAKNSFLLFVLAGLVFFHTTLTAIAQISFEQTSLDFNNHGEVASGTSLQFGPDGRLYVGQLNGEIKIYDITKSDRNAYHVEGVETVMGVKSIPNHDDNGQPAYDNRSKRQSTGLTVAGTRSHPVIYIGSSDPKWGGPSGDKALDTNSGIITRLTWNGSEWEVVDLVRGLPRSEENHSTKRRQVYGDPGQTLSVGCKRRIDQCGIPVPKLCVYLRIRVVGRYFKH